MTNGFISSKCGVHHDDLPMSYGADAPYWYDVIAPEERDRRTELTSDQCVIDEKHFFVRGVLEIPVVDGEGPFIWGVWVSLSEANFLRASELWDRPGREQEPPYFGWLSTELPGYPSTINLKTLVHTRTVGLRPTIEIELTDHPLAKEQEQGITMARVQEIAQQLLHEDDD
jgi:hypothetical protein